jgi:DNA-directed RNA polymerase subunit RPC12/RpoP
MARGNEKGKAMELIESTIKTWCEQEVPVNKILLIIGQVYQPSIKQEALATWEGKCSRCGSRTIPHRLTEVERPNILRCHECNARGELTDWVSDPFSQEKLRQLASHLASEAFNRTMCEVLKIRPSLPPTDYTKMEEPNLSKSLQAAYQIIVNEPDIQRMAMLFKTEVLDKHPTSPNAARYRKIVNDIVAEPRSVEQKRVRLMKFISDILLAGSGLKVGRAAPIDDIQRIAQVIGEDIRYNNGLICEEMPPNVSIDEMAL